jgi:hypothetical protein
MLIMVVAMLVLIASSPPSPLRSPWFDQEEADR